jgi:hypothetical protein
MSPFRSCALALAATLGVVSAPAGALTSATAYAAASKYTLLCSTCSIDFFDLGSVSDGGPGETSAAVNHSGAGYSGIATSVFAGPEALPELGVYAFADEIYDGLRTHLYEAFASATGLQQYTYGGAAPETYTITYAIDGEFFLNHDDAASLMSIYGGVTIFGAGYSPGQEVQPTLDYEYSGENAELVGTHDFALAGSVTFTVQPGDVFYVSATLFAIADSSHEVTGSVNALHTLELEFAGGDTALLTPEAAAVPEPGTAALVLAGLALGGGVLRRRR